MPSNPIKAKLLLLLRLSPKNLELGLSLLYQIGITTLEEKRRGRTVELIAQIPERESPEKLLKELENLERSLFPKGIFSEKGIITLKNDHWSKEYQKFLKPFPLRTPSGIPNLSPIIIDPRGKVPKNLKKNVLYINAGLAFGTGTHASTQLTALLIEEVTAKGKIEKMLDLGCGTGILAMIGKKRGVKEIDAVDNDPEALKVARSNLSINCLKGIRLLRKIPPSLKKFDLVVANIVSETLKELQRSIVTRLAKKGYLVLSGLLYKDCKEIIKTYRELRLIKRINKKGWSALLFQKV